MLIDLSILRKLGMGPYDTTVHRLIGQRCVDGRKIWKDGNVVVKRRKPRNCSKTLLSRDRGSPIRGIRAKRGCKYISLLVLFPNLSRITDTALREIGAYQSSVDHLVPKIAMQRLIREISMDVSGRSDLRWRMDALAALHESVEAYMVCFFEGMVTKTVLRLSTRVYSLGAITFTIVSKQIERNVGQFMAILTRGLIPFEVAQASHRCKNIPQTEPPYLGVGYNEPNP